MKTPAYLEKLSAEVEARVQKVHDTFIEKVTKKHALPLLNKFQAKVSFPVEMFYCNGDHWIEGQNGSILTDFNDALLTLAHPDYRVRQYAKAFEKQIEELFPEMVELYQLYYAFDGYHGNPLLADLKPTVQPRKNKGALDDKLEYFSED
jgi:hypothetical protein